MILELYWQYLVLGLVVYLTLNLLYVKWKLTKSSRNGEIIQKTIVEKDVDEEDNGERWDDSLSPALPSDLKHVPYNFHRLPIQNSLSKSSDFYILMNHRRSVRHFSKDHVPKEIVYNIIKTAATAPSGAHTEPWTYCLVSSDEMRLKVRAIIEEEEEINYKKRMSKVWTTDLQPLRTNWIKEYLTDAPHLILVFKQMYSIRENGKKKLHYYNEQSVFIAAGMLLTAIHYAGLVSLTSTPLNCGPALRSLLRRPISEKLVLLLPVGYPTEDCLIPDLHRKPLKDVLVEF